MVFISLQCYSHAELNKAFNTYMTCLNPAAGICRAAFCAQGFVIVVVVAVCRVTFLHLACIHYSHLTLIIIV